MDALLAPFHPIIVHTPLALLVFSLAFELVGLATDSEWWRKAAFLLLLIGTVGAVLAVLSGTGAEHIANRTQRIDHDAIEAHQDMGKLTMWIALGAVAARLVAFGMRQGRTLISGLALLLQGAAVVTVVTAGLRGGNLVYQHGAGVKVNGAYVSPRPPGERPQGES